MDESAKEARREYLRNWRKRNPDKIKANTERFWARKAKEAKETGTAATEEERRNQCKAAV